MLDLEDPIWQTIKGGYKSKYDASKPLRTLESASDDKSIDDIWDELFEELHHQGDVGLASYLAIPQLIRISIKINKVDWRLLALCQIIEQQRHKEQNPILPEQYLKSYTNSLVTLYEIAFKMLSDKSDINLGLCLSTIATCKGNIKLGEAIMNLNNDDTLNDF